MKIFTILTLILASFTLSTASIYGAKNELIVSSEILSPEEYNHLNDSNIGKNLRDQYGTILSIENMPDVSTVKLKIERPLIREFPEFKNQKYHMEVDLPKGSLLAMCKQLGKDKPGVFLTSPGFLPGEEVKVVLECEGYKSKPLVLSPHPIKLTSRVDDAFIKATLTSTLINNYNFTFIGFQPGETIKYTSNNCGETLSGEIEAKDNITFSLMCGVVGNKGGFDIVKFYRSNGEIFEVKLPWGNILAEYLAGQRKAVVAN